MDEELTFRSDYVGDRAAFLALADLLRDTFDIDISLLDRLGGPDPTAMPFGYFDPAGTCVANFSAFEMPLVVDGRRVLAVGYQSGAVRPAYRGKGLYRALMRRAFAWAEALDFELAILLTDKPDLYEQYGFRSVEQHFFSGAAPERPRPTSVRPLMLDDVDDVRLIRHVLA